MEAHQNEYFESTIDVTNADEDSDYFAEEELQVIDNPHEQEQYVLSAEELKRDESLKELFSSQLFEHNLKEYDDYDIIKEIDKRITAAVYVHNADQLNQAMKQQERKLLYDGCKLTVDEFKHEYLKFVSANSLSNQSAVSLLDFIKKLLPDSNLLPSSININVNDVQHQKPDAANCNSVIEFENCNCGQTIYVAKNKDLNQCPICRFGRYSNNKDKRYPISLMNYRSIIMILYQLLQTNEFYNTIQNVKYKDTRNHFYSNVMDGEVATKHMREMNEKFENHKIMQQNDNIKPVNLLLCLQFDGAQVFHHSVRNFWPMLITILNLPPTLRKEIGVGTFLISLFTAYNKSISEKFLFYKLLLPELQQLYEGILLPPINGVTYCVQARLILHCYDSRALEHVLNVHGSGSEIGCSLCRLAPG
jgi:hypothetical protein